MRFDEVGTAGAGGATAGGGNFFGDVTIIAAATALVEVTVVAVTVLGITVLGGPTTVYVTEGCRKCRGPDTTGGASGAAAGTRTGATGARCKKWPEPLVCRPFTT